MKAYCLFEQSGTFKNEFRKLGVEAYDFDIRNDFGETDKVVDLYAEIRGGYECKPSLFDELEPEDIVFAFFPCTRFSTKAQVLFKGENYQQKNWTDKQKLEYSMQMHAELSENYEVLTKLVLIAIDRKFRLIIENPYSQPHYLTNYWPLSPKLVDKDRRQDGDYYKKPTQYWFVNCDPGQTLLFEALEDVEDGGAIIHATGSAGKSPQVIRSMIHPQYASRFIRQYIL